MNDEMREAKKCCICGGMYYGFGNNPYPVDKTEGARCCDDCNSRHVIIARLLERVNKK